jgi:hypothetical protein
MTAVNVTVVSVIAGLTRNLCKKKRLFGHLLLARSSLETAPSGESVPDFGIIHNAQNHLAYIFILHVGWPCAWLHIRDLMQESI